MVLIQYFRFADKMECVIMVINLCLMLLAIHHYKYKKATIEDINELVRTRTIVLRAANKLTDDT